MVLFTYMVSTLLERMGAVDVIVVSMDRSRVMIHHAVSIFTSQYATVTGQVCFTRFV
mgnify:CR=1 FL=1